MTVREKPYEGFASTVRHLGRVVFQPKGNDRTRFRTFLPEPAAELMHVLILFEGMDYPFQRHYLYARHRDNSTPYTYSNMEFHPAPPGLRVGPWPGWRGVPNFPEVTLTLGEVTVPVTMMPWGDELKCKAIRGGASIDFPASHELICTTTDSRLRPTYADVYGGQQSRAVPMPVSLLPQLHGVHPRLLVTRSDIPSMRKKALGSHRSHWNRIITLLDNMHLPWEVTPESKIPHGPERLRGDDRALITALASLVEPSSSNSSLARDSLQQFIRETQQPQYQPLTIDTQAGETLFILSLCYDWTHDQWSDAERRELRTWLWKVADMCWSHLGYQRRDYGQAHYLGCALGLLAFSLLFWEEHPRAHEWVAHCRGVMNLLTEMLPQDGFYPHGINLWIYEYGFLFRWLELFRVCTGTDLWHTTDNWRNASAFRGASTSPDGCSAITFGDPQYRVGGDSWCHYLVASRTNSPYAQSLGDALLEEPPVGVDFRNAPPRRRVYEFLYYDPEIPATQSAEQVRVFRDGGQVFIRQGGESPSLFTFRAGAPLGHQRYVRGEHGGYGHADPANGSFLLCLGTQIAVAGPGPTYRRETSLHNTITFDGQGQIGDSTVWLPEFIPPEVICPTAQFRNDGGRTSISATLSSAYLPHLAVELCHRAVWIDPGRCIVGVDNVRCSHSSSIEWNIHSPGISGLKKEATSLAFDLAGPEPFLRLLLLNPLNVQPEIGVTEMLPAYPHDGTRTMYLRLAAKGVEARFVWCLLLDPQMATPALSMSNNAPAILLESGLRLVYLDGFLTADNTYDTSTR